MDKRRRGVSQGDKGELSASSEQQPSAQGLYSGQPKERPDRSHDRHLRSGTACCPPNPEPCMYSLLPHLQDNDMPCKRLGLLLL